MNESYMFVSSPLSKPFEALHRDNIHTHFATLIVNWPVRHSHSQPVLRLPPSPYLFENQRSIKENVISRHFTENKGSGRKVFRPGLHPDTFAVYRFPYKIEF